MGKRYLIDSNVIIDYVSLLLPPKGSAFVEQILNEAFIISIAVKIEVLGYNYLPSKLRSLEELIGES